MAQATLLEEFSKAKDWFVGLDSDGCVFDSMEIKQKECFAPMFIKHWDLQPAAKYARRVWEFTNLYSVDRGVNRFPALVKALDALQDWPDAAQRGLRIPDLAPLRDFVRSGLPQSNASLEKVVAENGHPVLTRTLAWSKAVNAAVADIVRGVPPFARVVGCLERITARADLAVVSGTPTEALRREWKEQGIDSYPQLIAGQELGTKSHHLTVMTEGGKHYEQEHMLMIGDAPGDLEAARAVGALFFPINPGHEEESWERLHGEALDLFFRGKYAGGYEKDLIAEFEKLLPSTPPWKQ